MRLMLFCLFLRNSPANQQKKIYHSNQDFETREKDQAAHFETEIKKKIYVYIKIEKMFKKTSAFSLAL